MSVPELAQFHGDGSVSMVWAGDLRKFRLAPFGRLKELQDLCNAGPMEILRALQEDRWRVEYYREVLRLGLLGAGCREIDVVRLIKRYVDEAPPLESVLPAVYVLTAGLTWPKEAIEALGKSEPERTTTEEAGTADLSSPRYTEPAQQSGSPPGRLMKSPRGSLPRASKAGTKSMGARKNQNHQPRNHSTV